MAALAFLGSIGAGLPSLNKPFITYSTRLSLALTSYRGINEEITINACQGFSPTRQFVVTEHNASLGSTVPPTKPKLEAD